MDYKNILVILLAVASVIYAVKNKGDLTLSNIISELIIIAKDNYFTKSTESKFDFVLASTRESLPFPLNLLISESKIKETINSIYQNKFKSEFFNAENKQMVILDQINDMLITGTNTTQALLKVTEMKNDVKNKGYVEGFVNTDFKNTTAGIKAGIKF